MEKDVMKIGVPNINFSIFTKGDNREEKFKKQRIERGFDESETWDLGQTIMMFTIPRLKEFIRIAEKNIEEPDFIKGCKCILKSFELLTRDEGIRIFNEKEKKDVKKGLKLLPSYMESLWW